LINWIKSEKSNQITTILQAAVDLQIQLWSLGHQEDDGDPEGMETQ
jgi:hypothetical protein